MPYREGKKWRGVIKQDGKRIATKKFETKQEAKTWEFEEKKKLKSLEKKQQEGMDLLNFCSKYLDYATRYQKKIYDEKKSVCKRILKFFGSNTPVESITSEMIENFLVQQKQNRSANASNKDRKNMLAMWNKGVKTFGLLSNPVANTEKFAHDRQMQYTPSSDDVAKLLMVANRKERVFLDAYLQTGARRSEIYRWTWVDDINLEKRVYRLGTRKTKDGSMQYDFFPMSDILYESLKWWWENRPIKTSPYVFVDDQPGPHYGKPYKERRRFMNGLCERAGIKPFGFHALRRFVASSLADKGKSTNTIRRILRHQNVSTTERYIQNINDDLKDTLNELSDFELKVHRGGTPNKKGLS